MSSCLAVTALAFLTSCATPSADSSKRSNMSEILAKEVRLSFTGPQTLPLPVVLRDSPAYDAPRNFFTVTLKNESSKQQTIPFDELQRNTITKYRNPDTGAEIVNNRTPPPKQDGAVLVLAPGETKSFQVVFEYPAKLQDLKNKVAELSFCVKWESSWLRKQAYAPDAYNWNESFELCREIRITAE